MIDAHVHIEYGHNLVRSHLTLPSNFHKSSGCFIIISYSFDQEMIFNSDSATAALQLSKTLIQNVHRDTKSFNHLLREIYVNSLITF